MSDEFKRSSAAGTPQDGGDFYSQYYEGMYNEPAREFYGYSDFYNFGYWGDGARDQKEASESLIERLVGYLPNTTGRILDVACGMGASTRHLLKHFSASDVVGINISERQLETCRRNAPECTFHQMDAVGLRFEDESFDHVMCVEASFHFETRERFFKEAWRVLKPGGTLVTSDILFRGKPNPEATPQEYHALLMRSGFEGGQVLDTTEDCLVQHRRRLRQFTIKKAIENPGLWEEQRPRVVARQMVLLALKCYVIAWARKGDCSINP